MATRGEVAAPGGRQPQVAHDVLDDDDRVVHQDPDGEDEGEERDAVERVAENVENEEGERERDRHGQQHDTRLPPAEGDRHQQGDRQRRDRHVLQELVGLLGRRLAVVARDGRVDARREEARAEAVELAVDRVHDRDRVCAPPLAHGQGDGRKLSGASRLAVRHVGDRLLGTVDDARDVGQANRPAAALCHDDGLELRGAAHEAARLDEDLPAAGDDRARGRAPVGGLERAEDRAGRQSPGGQPRRVELHAELAPQASDQGRIRDLGDRLDLVLHLGRDLAQRRRILRRAPERHRPDRHVVDRAGLDERRRHVPRPIARERIELRADAHERPIGILPHAEAHDEEGPAGRGGRVHVLHARDRPEGLLERSRDLPLDLDRSAPRQRREDVDHRDLDLRLFLAGRDDDGQGTQGHGEKDDERSQLRIHERARQATGDSEPSLRHDPPLRIERHELTRVPASRSAGGSMTTRSPAARPDRTSTRPSPAAGPVLT